MKNNIFCLWLCFGFTFSISKDDVYLCEKALAVREKLLALYRFSDYSYFN